MKRELRRWEIVGFAVTGLVGTLLHFVYGWSDGSRVAAAFSAVNESTWEHMKLLFLPYFVFAVVEFIVFSEVFRNFFAVKAVSILLGLAAIPTLFYTCAGAFGELPGWGNILIFFLADALAYLVGYRWLTDGCAGARCSLRALRCCGRCCSHLSGSPTARRTCRCFWIP